MCIELENSKGLLRKDIDEFRTFPIIEKFTRIFVGDITKFYFRNGDFQYRIRYDEDYNWFNQNRESGNITKPLNGTDWSKRNWYFGLNEVPPTMNQYIPPYGRKDRMDYAKKYPINPKDELNYIVHYGGVSPNSELTVAEWDIAHHIYQYMLRFNEEWS